MSEQTSYLGYLIEVRSDRFVVYQDGQRVGEAYSMTGARALVRKLRKIERAA